jgi:hypothetical protein
MRWLVCLQVNSPPADACPLSGFELLNLMSHIARTFADHDQERLDTLVDAFRLEFACWVDMFENNWDLLDFVIYEGVELPIVNEVGPLILGEKCVALHGAEWCVVQRDDGLHFAITHKDIAVPVDLTTYKPHRLRRTLSRKWQRLLDMNHPNR